MCIKQQKQNLRSILRQKRRDFPHKKQASLKIAENLRHFLQAQILQAQNPPPYHLGLYYPTKNEASLLGFSQKYNKDYLFALPKISANGHMFFTAWQAEHPLYKDDLSIFVPYGETQIIPHIICVPLLGFTAQKYRLGQGGGYYDKYIHSHKKHNILWLGVAFECQKLLDMPLEKHDEKLDFIITEKQIY